MAARTLRKELDPVSPKAAGTCHRPSIGTEGRLLHRVGGFGLLPEPRNADTFPVHRSKILRGYFFGRKYEGLLGRRQHDEFAPEIRVDALSRGTSFRDDLELAFDGLLVRRSARRAGWRAARRQRARGRGRGDCNRLWRRRVSTRGCEEDNEGKALHPLSIELPPILSGAFGPRPARMRTLPGIWRWFDEVRAIAQHRVCPVGELHLTLSLPESLERLVISDTELA
jgi:hypothetical protein